MDWLDKYKPKNFNDYYGNEQSIKKIKDWINKFQKKKKPKLIRIK